MVEFRLLEQILISKRKKYKNVTTRFGRQILNFLQKSLKIIIFEPFLKNLKTQFVLFFILHNKKYPSIYYCVE